MELKHRPGILEPGRQSVVRLLDRAARPRMFSASHADRCVLDSRREAVRRTRHGDPDLGHAGGGRNVRVHREAAGDPAHAVAGGPEPLRLSETGAAVRAAAHARSAHAGVPESRRRGDHAHSDHTRADARSCCSPAISRCAWSTIACRSRSIIRRCCRAPARAARCWTSFAATPNCVLFATSSFWQGVDVQGDQLSCVIIDKLPFAVPSDPVVEARIQRIREDGGQSVLRLSDSAGGAGVEAGIRTADPQQDGPRRAGSAGQSNYQAALRAGVFR